MNTTNEKVTSIEQRLKLEAKEIGQRLKLIAKEKGYSNQDMADLLHYANVKSISQIYSGKVKLTIDRLETISKEFELRKEYLLCIDNFKTEKERLSLIKGMDLINMQFSLNYFRTLGYEFKPFYFWLCCEYDYVKIYDELKEYFYDSETERKRFKALSLKQRLSDHVNIRIKLNEKADLFLDTLESINDITKQDTHHWKNSELFDNGEAIILFEIIHDNKLINYVPMHKMKCFLNHIDNICKSSAQYLLSSETFAHIDYEFGWEVF